MIVDMHVHCGEVDKHFKSWWMTALQGGFLRSPDRTIRVVKNPIDKIISDLDECGVDKACVMGSDHRRPYPYDSLPSYTPNEYVAEVVRKHPDRLLGVCSFDPIRSPYDARVGLEKCVKEWDMRAVKLYPTDDHYYPADEVVFPLYEKAIELDIPVHFHMGYSSSVNAPMKYQRPWLLDEVGIRFPKLKVIVAHLGFPWVDECLCMIDRHKNFYGDIAYLGGLQPKMLREALEKFGYIVGFDRLLYGSDNAWTATYAKTLKNLNDTAEEKGFEKISDQDMKKILGENAKKLYKIKE